MKKALAFLLTVILAVTPVLALASAAYTPGTYEGTAKGFGGAVTVTVCFYNAANLCSAADFVFYFIKIMLNCIKRYLCPGSL